MNTDILTTILEGALAVTSPEAAAALPEVAWVTLLLLGAAHGINPAMGWLFAVSLGLQSQKRRAVWSALGPLALGHAASIGVTVLAVALLGRVVPLQHLKWVVAVLLISVGISHLVRHRHPRFGGMRVGARDLTVWSFLVATAHGAGLMAVPFILGSGHAAAHGPGHEVIRASAVPGEWLVGLLGSAVHAVGYLLVTALVGVIVYEWMGLRLLRKAWINLDLIWALALIVTGILTPLL